MLKKLVKFLSKKKNSNKISLGYDFNTSSNFHNVLDIFFIPKQILYESNGVILYSISFRQWKRIKNHFCGHKDCTCESGPTLIDINEKTNRVTIEL